MNPQRTYKFLISGGGTGGHIYPAIAIADELKSRYPNAEFLFVGANDRMEMEKVPNAGYKIVGLWITGIQRKLTLKNLSFPFKLASSLLKSRKIIKTFKPDVAIGTGGFASGPALYAAYLAKVPTLIQEQNSYPGITNKILSKKVDRICVAYKGLSRFFPKEKILLTGNPIRKDLLTANDKSVEAVDKYNLEKGKPVLLVLGGSLGARSINRLVEDKLDLFKDLGVQLIWQCGKLYYDEYKKHDQLEHVQVHSFLNEMELAYAASDIIISRAGASSVSELCVVGKPVIFIPSPNVAEDHQTKNAQAVVNENAAIMLKESELDKKFDSTFKDLINDDDLRKSLGQKIKKLALTNATNDIVDEIEKLLK